MLSKPSALAVLICSDTGSNRLRHRFTRLRFDRPTGMILESVSRQASSSGCSAPGGDSAVVQLDFEV
jgi:hypothetical protein